MGYRKLDERDIAYLKKVTEDGRVLTGSDISQDYSHDEPVSYTHLYAASSEC